MSLSLLRSRAIQQLSKTPTHKTLNNLNSNSCRRFFSSNPPKEPPLSSASSTTYDDPFYSPPPPPPPPPPPKRNAFATALKFGFTAAFTGLVAATGYATYAYTVDEIDKKTKGFRASLNYSTKDDATTINKLRSAIVSAPAKAIDLYLDIRSKIEEHVREFSEPLSDKLLPDLPPQVQIYTLVVDLNETLVYSDWKRERGWRTFKRPGVDAFLEHLGQYYEIVVYSDSLQMYVDPIIERLDEKHSIAHRLSRAATLYKDGKHYRDLSKLNRDPRRVIYISGHALEQCLQPENCVQIKPWTTDDVTDTTLLDLIPFLEFLAKSGPPDVRKVLASYEGRDIAKEFIERSKEYHRKQQKPSRSWRR
ncbi:hypothetical protein RND81_06G090900 [Saponaria officinalis]|uniref:Mitochondrial import inner membrane translocase subunit TIM50 n=1 Tax=Saponaria officinalis TaxID=3572 RepID=A0AAW1K935_SAPOF